jgi:hypothetical protein
MEAVTVDLEGTGCADVDCVDLAHDRAHLWTFENSALNFRFL